MKKLFSSVLAIGAFTAMLSSCGAVQAPVIGMIYTNVQAPTAVTSNSVGTRVGKAQATGILGLVATGDASVNTAARNAGIKKVSHVDYEAFNILGIFTKYTTVVYGE